MIPPIRDCLTKQEYLNFKKFNGEGWGAGLVTLNSTRIEMGIKMLEAAKPGYKKSLRQVIDQEIAWNKELFEIERAKENIR